MPTVALTDRFVAGVRVQTRQNYFDSKTRGLTLRVSPSGAKVWMFTYRTQGKATQWLRLGDLDGLTLAAARTLAATHRHAIDVAKLDPVAEQKAALEAAQAAAEAAPEPAVMTFDKFVPVYLATAKGRKSTWREDDEKIRRCLVPAWGPLPLASITRRHVHELLDTLVAKGLTVGVNRVQALISRMFSVAVDRSLVDAHPASRMEKRFTETPRDRTLTDDEIRALVAGLKAHPGRAADAVMLRLYTGQRGKQIASMEWVDVDLDAKTWRVPRGQMKNRRPHLLPLVGNALAILTRRRQELPDDQPRVFPHLTLLSDDYRDLSTVHGGAYEWKDLRRTMSTRLGDMGYSEIVPAVLSHARTGVTDKHYNLAKLLPEKRAALEAWDRELARILANKPKARARVVPMRGAR
jgi:integrase